MLSLHDIHDAIEVVSEQLGDLVEEIRESAYEAAVTEASFKETFSQERLLARVNAEEADKKITVDQVEDRATVATGAARQEYLVAQNRLVTAREALRARIAQLDGLRSQAASYRGAGG